MKEKTEEERDIDYDEEESDGNNEGADKQTTQQRFYIKHLYGVILLK